MLRSATRPARIARIESGNAVGSNRPSPLATSGSSAAPPETGSAGCAGGPPSRPFVGEPARPEPLAPRKCDVWGTELLCLSRVELWPAVDALAAPCGLIAAARAPGSGEVGLPSGGTTDSVIGLVGCVGSIGFGRMIGATSPVGSGSGAPTGGTRGGTRTGESTGGVGTGAIGSMGSGDIGTGEDGGCTGSGESAGGKGPSTGRGGSGISAGVGSGAGTGAGAGSVYAGVGKGLGTGNSIGRAGIGTGEG